MNTVRILFSLLATLGLSTSAHALGFELGETKEELKLDYQVTVTDHKTDRVTVVFTLKDEGRMKPLYSVDLPQDRASGREDVSTNLVLSSGAHSSLVGPHILAHSL